jgi:glutamate-5-semialdehyde dehydrogenase
MSVNTQSETQIDLDAYCQRLGERAQAASRKLTTFGGARRTAALRRIAEALDQNAAALSRANAEDLAQAAVNGLAPAMIDRLRLTPAGVAKMAESVRQIAAQVDPVGQMIEGYVRPSGLKIEKVRVPLGVVLIIFESRPNVTSDAAALCLKGGNAVILRGGKEAIHSNTAIAAVIRGAIQAEGLDPDLVQLVETTDHGAIGRLVKMEGVIDLVIPRGGEKLIRAVVEQARIPVIKHYTGNCHVYVDAHAAELPPQMVVDICINAKVQRTGVCNAAETLLFHAAVPQLVREVCKAMAEQGVELRACEQTRKLIAGLVPAAQLKSADESDWYAEYLDKIIAVKVVGSIDEAAAHINKYGSHHTEAILTANIPASDSFVAQVDSANVMVNCSTRFSDGGEYGLGAEIGISTDKLHSRGPMGAADLTTYKWVVRGNGQTRQ